MIDSYTFGTFVVDGKKFDSNIVLMHGSARPDLYLEGHILR